MYVISIIIIIIVVVVVYDYNILLIKYTNTYVKMFTKL